jgi:hypothetical protein
MLGRAVTVQAQALHVSPKVPMRPEVGRILAVVQAVSTLVEVVMTM